jgi:two-component system response regulator AtoC
MRKKILAVDDEKLVRWSIARKLTEWGYDVVEAETGAEALKVFERESPDFVLLDNNLPDTMGTELLPKIKNARTDVQVIMMTAYGSIETAVVAVRGGAYDFITKPIDFLKLQNILKNAHEAFSLKKEVAYYKEREKKTFGMEHIVAESEAMRGILEMTDTIAQSEASIVLLQGESGTGKDLVARAIHFLSRRRDRVFLAINCSAIPENLLESELFGYEKGAFTDAKSLKRGQVELADGGTLFLDEISTLSLPLQAKLLRFLETMTIKHVGGLKDIDVDLRVVAATNQDLDSETKAGRFRQDLFFRLNACPIHIPPLRERPKDIIPLARYFILKNNIKFRKGILGLSPEAERLFLDYDWPGNVRELKNAIERAMIFEKGSHITPQHLPFRPGPGADPQKASQAHPVDPAGMSLRGMEKAMLLAALKKAKGNKSEAARILEISRDTLRYKIKKCGIAGGDKTS